MAVGAVHLGRLQKAAVPFSPVTPQRDVRLERLMGYSDHCHGHWRNLFAAMGVAPHELSYEALVADYRQAIATLFARLGSSAEPPPVRMRRQADGHSEALALRYLRERAARRVETAP